MITTAATVFNLLILYSVFIRIAFFQKLPTYKKSIKQLSKACNGSVDNFCVGYANGITTDCWRRNDCEQFVFIDKRKMVLQLTIYDGRKNVTWLQFNHWLFTANVTCNVTGHLTSSTKRSVDVDKRTKIVHLSRRVPGWQQHDNSSGIFVCAWNYDRFIETVNNDLIDVTSSVFDLTTQYIQSKDVRLDAPISSDCGNHTICFPREDCKKSKNCRLKLVIGVNPSGSEVVSFQLGAGSTTKNVSITVAIANVNSSTSIRLTCRPLKKHFYNLICLQGVKYKKISMSSNYAHIERSWNLCTWRHDFSSINGETFVDLTKDDMFIISVELDTGFYKYSRTTQSPVQLKKGLFIDGVEPFVPTSTTDECMNLSIDSSMTSESLSSWAATSTTDGSTRVSIISQTTIGTLATNTALKILSTGRGTVATKSDGSTHYILLFIVGAGFLVLVAVAAIISFSKLSRKSGTMEGKPKSLSLRAQGSSTIPTINSETGEIIHRKGQII